MNKLLRAHADQIIRETLAAVMPDEGVRRALQGRSYPGRVFLVAAGKAAWQMASAARSCLGEIAGGVVITKYDHVKRDIPGCTCYEAGHPVPDENSFAATKAALELTKNLCDTDTVLFLLSGGGSALFEMPRIPAAQLQDITRQLLACGADITEINTLRKRLSFVKGGQFARHCAPAQVHTIVLSDVLGNPLDMIASGPAYPDSTTCEDALRIAEKYNLRLSEEALACLRTETPKALDNVQTQIGDSVTELCAAAEKAAQKLGYNTLLLTDSLCCQAKEAGRFLASIAKTHRNTKEPLAFIAGGETVVQLTGDGLGGRNQEIAIAAAQGIAGLDNAAVFSIGSDGTDGPTDAAGGYADGDTLAALKENGLTVHDVLARNDAYHALTKTGGLIITGPTGTNVNDVAVVLVQPAS